MLASCTTMNPFYGNRYKYQYSLTEPQASTPMIYSDSIIDILFSISDKEIDFQLKNKTNLPIKLDWNSVSIVMFGKANRVVHSGVKYIDRNASQAYTMIPPLASIDDIVLPTDKVYYREGYYGAYTSIPGGWETSSLFPTYDMNKQGTADLIYSLKGTEFSLFMPLALNKEDINYNFVFKIDDVTKIESVQSSQTSRKKSSTSSGPGRRH